MIDLQDQLGGAEELIRGIRICERRVDSCRSSWSYDLTLHHSSLALLAMNQKPVV